MTRRKKMVERVTDLMDKPEHIRNIGIVAHIDHGKTTLSDNLLAGAGMISEELAGRQLFMDSDEEEQARGITIDASNVSMVHEYAGEEYLINMIDTPGHVDFGGDVTRAMRAVDGAVVVVDAVEGTMPQTETVLRQALKEGVRPVLFINKVDRLINELKVNEQEMQIRLARVIDKVNKLIKGMNEKMYNEGWKLDAAKGTVAFGSALYKWAVSIPFMKKSGVSFKEVYEKCNSGDMKWLAKNSPLHAVLLDMVVKHLPNPIEAQHRRIPIIWHGDYSTPEGKAMINCDPNGPVCLMVTDISFDPHAGEVATGRLFAPSTRTPTTSVPTETTSPRTIVAACRHDELPTPSMAAITTTSLLAVTRRKPSRHSRTADASTRAAAPTGTSPLSSPPPPSVNSPVRRTNHASASAQPMSPRLATSVMAVWLPL